MAPHPCCGSSLQSGIKVVVILQFILALIALVVGIVIFSVGSGVATNADKSQNSSSSSPLTPNNGTSPDSNSTTTTIKNSTVSDNSASKTNAEGPAAAKTNGPSSSPTPLSAVSSTTPVPNFNVSTTTEKPTNASDDSTTKTKDEDAVKSIDVKDNSAVGIIQGALYLIIGIYYFVLGVLLLKGAQQRDIRKCKIWLIFRFILVAIEVSVVVLGFVYATGAVLAGGIISILFIVINLHFIWVVWAFIGELKAGVGAGRRN